MKISKRFILGPAVALTAIGAIIGGVAAAAPNGDGDATGTATPNPKQQVIEQAAGALGIDPTTLQDALSQARQQVMLDELQARLDQAVTDGKITQEEADAIKAWIDARPAAVDQLGGGFFGFGRHGMRGHGFGFGRFGGPGFGPHGQMPDDGSTPTPSTTDSGLTL